MIGAAYFCGALFVATHPLNGPAQWQLSIGNPLGQVGDWVTTVVETLGYTGVAVLLFLETLFPPLPSEGVLPLAGFLSGQGRLSFLGVVLAATAGSVAGAVVMYVASRALGPDRVRKVVRRIPLLDEADLDRALDWFARHGRAAVCAGRLVPMVRSLISVPAGLERMPFAVFLAYTTVGSAVWNAVLVGLGWAVGDQWHRVQDAVQLLAWVAVAAATVFVVGFIIRRRARGVRSDT